MIRIDEQAEVKASKTMLQAELKSLSIEEMENLSAGNWCASVGGISLGFALAGAYPAAIAAGTLWMVTCLSGS